MKGMDSVAMYRDVKDTCQKEFKWEPIQLNINVCFYWLLIWNNSYEMLVLMFLKMNDIALLIYTSI